jgi:hypothetical protein
VAAAVFFKCARANGTAEVAEVALLLDNIKARAVDGNIAAEWAYGLLAADVLGREYAERLLAWYVGFAEAKRKWAS